MSSIKLYPVFYEFKMYIFIRGKLFMREIINIVSFNSPTGATSFPLYLSLTNTIFSHFPTYPFTFRGLRGEERGTLELFGLYHGVLANLFTEIRIAQVENKIRLLNLKGVH